MDLVEIDPDVPATIAVLLQDAQTSGGMLIAAPGEAAGALAADLRARGVQPAIVGRVVHGAAGRIRVRRSGPPDMVGR